MATVAGVIVLLRARILPLTPQKVALFITGAAPLLAVLLNHPDLTPMHRAAVLGGVVVLLLVLSLEEIGSGISDIEVVSISSPQKLIEISADFFAKKYCRESYKAMLCPDGTIRKGSHISAPAKLIANGNPNTIAIHLRDKYGNKISTPKTLTAVLNNNI